MILLIDNYDSFSYNLVQEIGRQNPEIQAVRNDAVTIEEIALMKPSHIVLSPGPGYPAQAGICEEVVRRLGGKIPILGVCLGHQAICEAYGGVIEPARQLMHGKKSQISIDTEEQLFSGLPEEMEVARYHSLIARERDLPKTLKVIARAKNGEIMAVRHKELPVFGLQFHPESILTPEGGVVIKNFLEMYRV